MDIQEINNKIDILVGELEKLKSLKKAELEKIEHFNVDLVFHYDPSEPETIQMHTKTGNIPVSSINELVRFCKNIGTEEDEDNPWVALAKYFLESKNDHD